MSESISSTQASAKCHRHGAIVEDVTNQEI